MAPDLLLLSNLAKEFTSAAPAHRVQTPPVDFLFFLRRDFQVDGGGGGVSEERPGGDERTRPPASQAPARPTRALTDGCVGAG